MLLGFRGFLIPYRETLCFFSLPKPCDPAWWTLSNISSKNGWSLWPGKDARKNRIDLKRAVLIEIYEVP